MPTGLVNRSIDKWLSVPVDEIVFTSLHMDEIVQQWQREKWQQENAQALLADLANHIPSDFEKTRKLFQLKALVLMRPDGSIESGAVEPEFAGDAFLRGAIQALGSNKDVFVPLNGDSMGIRRADRPNGQRILAAIFPSHRDIADFSADNRQRESAITSKLKSNRIFFRNTYGAVLALMTVLVLFAAVWLGLFLSKRITEPIEALTAATREISAGNLDHRVDVKAGDELGMLVTMFNDMASRLQGTTTELETRRHYMEVILESIPTGVIALDPDLRIHTLNRAARTMFSVTAATHLDDLFKGDDLAEIHALLADATENGITREISFRTPGRPANSAVTASRLAAGGFVLVVEDLTEVVRAQRASAWREVARRLAHEIKKSADTDSAFGGTHLAQHRAAPGDVAPRHHRHSGMRRGDRRRSLEPEASRRRVCPIRPTAHCVARSQQHEGTCRSDAGSL